MRFAYAVIGLAAFGAAALYAPEIELVSGLEMREILFVAGTMATAMFFTSLLLTRSFAETLRYVRGFVAGLVCAVALVSAYNYRYDILLTVHRVSGELVQVQRPLHVRPNAEPDGDNAVRIRRRADGHFIARTAVEGYDIAMLIDTGASTVVLKPADAQRIGVDVERLRYTVPVQTANGTTYAASVRIKQLSIGRIEVRDVDALVSKPGSLKDSLLGMTFLSRLRSYEFSGDFLTLRI